MTTSTCVERRRLFARRALLSVTTIFCSGLAAPVFAQTTPGQVYSNIDANGVDVVTGSFNFSHTDLSIGPSQPSGLKYTTTIGNVGFTDNLTGFIGTNTSGRVSVSQASSSDVFQKSGSSFTSLTGRGATLSAPTATTYLYTRADSVQVGFTSRQTSDGSTLSHIDFIKYPDGRKITMTYVSATATNCPRMEPGYPCKTSITVERLASVITSDGYQLVLLYAGNGAPTYSNVGTWLTRTGIKAVNRAVEYCEPTSTPCSLTGNWPQISFGSNGSTKTVTDPNGNTWTYTMGSQVTGIRRPGSTNDDITVSYDSNFRVASVKRAGITWTYSYVDSGSQRTTTVTDLLAHKRTVISDLSLGQVVNDTNGNNETTTYEYYPMGQLKKVTEPNKNYVQYTYDTRGNVTEQRQVSNTPGTPADIVLTAHYSDSCDNTLTCNKPIWTQDTVHNQTDYTYDSVHGGLLSVTAPAPVNGAVRPQVNYSYTPFQAYLKDPSGAIAASGVSEYRLTATSTCRTQANCAGTSDEVKSATSYGPQSAGTGNNLLPVSTSSGAGDGSLTATTAMSYDAVGNLLTSSDPLGNTTRYRWDADRQMIGAVGPDPDGAGVNQNPAVRLTYSGDAQVTLAEQGIAPSQSDSDWANFSSRHQVATQYDANGRKAQESIQANGATSSVVQYSYDILGRLDCTALRMNPVAYGSLPGACDLSTQSSLGPDRISRNEYDAANRVNKVSTAYGTGDMTVNLTSYTPNGKTQSVIDGNGNSTSYAYDGLDRLYRTYYPNPSEGGSSTTDYEQIDYDAAGNVMHRWLRGTNNHQDYAYDALNRLTGITVPHLNQSDRNTTYTYNNLGQLTGANEENNRFTNIAYDALGRKVSEGSNAGGTKLFGYDLAGRRTRLTWQDGFYVTYGYDNAGRMTAAYDNTGAQLFYLSYDNDGLRTALCPNGSTGNQAICTQYGYNSAGRLTAQNLLGTSGTNMTFGGYSPAGQIGQRQNSNDAYAWTGAANVNKGYAVDGLNQYTGVAGAAIGYDPHGNLTSSAGRSYSYDSFNRLGEYDGGGSKWLYYDALGRLEWSNAPQDRFDYDGARLITELNTNNSIKRRYVYGPNPDQPVVWYEGSDTNDKRFVQSDERGSVIRVQRADTSTLAINSYDEYGTPAPTNQGRFGYTGQTWLPELGVWNYKARMYSPQLGRFMQIDPIGYRDGLNLYNYVHSDPINHVDSTGLNGCTDLGLSTSVIGYSYQDSYTGDYVDIGPICGDPIPQEGGGGGSFGGGSSFGGGGGQVRNQIPAPVPSPESQNDNLKRQICGNANPLDSIASTLSKWSSQDSKTAVGVAIGGIVANLALGGPLDPLGDAITAIAEVGAGVFEATSLVEGGLSAGAHLLATGDVSQGFLFGAETAMMKASGLGTIPGGLAEATADAVIDRAKEGVCE